VNDIVVDMNEAALAEEKVHEMMKKAHSTKPDEEQVQGCMHETRKYSNKVSQCANNAFDMFRLECMPVEDRGNDHGRDDAFFRDNSPKMMWSSRSGDTCDLTRPLSPELVTPPRLARHKYSPEDTVERNRNSPEAFFRSPKSMRYPQAAEIENPVDRSEREKNSPGHRDEDAEIREEAKDDDAEDLGKVMTARGDDQASLRAVRLQMYRVDDGQKTVPKARLSRALGELYFQDTTIESLQMSLENTKEILVEKEMELFEAQTMCKNHEQSIEELLAKASEVSGTLEARIEQESEEKVLLQNKVAALHEETLHLKAQLRAARDELSENASMWSKVTDGETQAQFETDGGDSVWTGISQEDDNYALIVRLRAEIVSLKSQLADKHAEHSQRSLTNSHLSPISEASSTSRSVDNSEDSRGSELMRLRSKLEIAEAELAALRTPEMQSRQVTTATVAALDLELTKTEGDLKNTTKELEEAMTREVNLRKELEDANKRIAELERELATDHMDSLQEIEKLQERLLNDSMEAEDAKKIALSELEESRFEVAELTAEVNSLTERLSKATEETEALTSDRLKQRGRLEEALLRSKGGEDELRGKIADLEEQLVNAEASSLQLVARSEGYERSVKRKLDESFDSIASRESFEVHERARLKEELCRSQANEEALRAEIEVMRNLLRGAEDLVEEMESEFKEENKQLKEYETLMMNEVNGLRSKLVASEEKTLRALTARANDLEEHSKHEEELRHCQVKQQALLNQLQLLRVTLDRVEIDRRQEKQDAEEARRIHNDMDSKRMEEIARLREELDKLRARAEKCNQLQSHVEELRVRLATALVESSEMKKSVISDSKKNDAMTRSFRGEISLIKGRLAAIRKRNASRRKVPKEDSSTEKSSSEESTSLSPRRSASLEKGSPASTVRSSQFSASTPSTAGSSKKHDWEFSPLTSPVRSRGSLPYDEKVAQQDAKAARQERLLAAKSRVDVPSLQKRLRESNQRLQDANVRLQGLAKSSDNMAEEQSRTNGLSDDLITLVAQHSDSSSPDRSFHQKLRIKVTHNETPAVNWLDEEEFSSVNWQTDLASI
jgi:chromosome segregation ATPase